MIDLQNISFSYGKRKILKDFTFHFHFGKFYGIFGANGCGKSTLLKLITGELKPAEGSVAPLFRDPMDRAKHIGFMEQQVPAAIPLMVRDIVELGRYPWRKSGEVFSVDPVLDRLNLTGLQKRIYSGLSGGEKQRVMLARALVQQTPVLLLDEPFSSFDMGNQRSFYRVLKELADNGTCVIMVTHDVFLSKDFLDEILFLKNGELHCHGSPENVFHPDVFQQIYPEIFQ